MKSRLPKSAKQQKERYKVTNWKTYNKALCQRGNVTIWMSADLSTKWFYQGKQHRGGKICYSAMAIEFCYTIRCLYNLGYRQTEGFVTSIFSLAGFVLSVPSYTQIQRRSQTLSCALKKYTSAKASIHIVIDSTGLKVYGEGEWKVKKHGWEKHRTWRKLHIGSNASNMEIVGIDITGNDISDAQAGIDVIAGIEEDILSCAGDGAYDKKKFRQCLPKDTLELIPPQRNAIVNKDKSGVLKQRNEAVKRIAEVGRKQWKQESGYHIRSLSEVNMHRYKSAFGGVLKARKPINETIEVTTKCSILNKFVQLGMPMSVKVA